MELVMYFFFFINFQVIAQNYAKWRLSLSWNLMYMNVYMFDLLFNWTPNSPIDILVMGFLNVEANFHTRMLWPMLTLFWRWNLVLIILIVMKKGIHNEIPKGECIIKLLVKVNYCMSLEPEPKVGTRNGKMFFPLYICK